MTEKLRRKAIVGSSERQESRDVKRLTRWFRPARSRASISAMEKYYEAQHGKNPHDSCGKPGASRLPGTAATTDRRGSALRPRRARKAGARGGKRSCPETGRSGDRYCHRRRARKIGFLRLRHRTLQRL